MLRIGLWATGLRGCHAEMDTPAPPPPRAIPQQGPRPDLGSARKGGGLGDCCTWPNFQTRTLLTGKAAHTVRLGRFGKSMFEPRGVCVDLAPAWLNIGCKHSLPQSSQPHAPRCTSALPEPQLSPSGPGAGGGGGVGSKVVDKKHLQLQTGSSSSLPGLRRRQDPICYPATVGDSDLWTDLCRA